MQGHTRTLWRLLERYHIPTFLFVNKMDLAGADRAVLMAELQRLDSGCVDFGQEDPASRRAWPCATREPGAISGDGGRWSRRRSGPGGEAEGCFPCWFGSALKLEGVAEFLEGLEQYAPRKCCPPEFGARCSRSPGTPRGPADLPEGHRGQPAGENAPTGGEGRCAGKKKADQIRIYSGAKYRAVEEAQAGTVCAVTGLSRTRPGEGLGFEAGGQPPGAGAGAHLPGWSCRRGAIPTRLSGSCGSWRRRTPSSTSLWDERLREIHIQLMGQVQLEILRQVIAQRFGLEVSFGAGSIVYRETIAAPVEGVGHFEPLRHYAEVHLLLEPGERGSGLRVGTACPPTSWT